MKYLIKPKEIFLKGKNRKFFEEILIKNIKISLKEKLKFWKKISAGILIETQSSAEEILQKIFGIAKFWLIEELNSYEKVKEKLLNEITQKGLKELSIEVKRSTKDFPKTSIEIKQDLTNFLKTQKSDLIFKKSNVKIEIIYSNKKFYLGIKQFPGLGGLPVGSSGKGIVLLSAGFDSPVASYLANKRGLKLLFVHFHSYPQTSKQSIEKVKKILEILKIYNLGAKLFLINILNLQKYLFSSAPKKYLVILYRRAMLRIANSLADQFKVDVIITGENLGQVASQTIENINTIEAVSKKLILRPLISFDKDEIIKLAEKINTAEIAKEPYQDCCSLFIPKHPITKSSPTELEEIEKNLPELEKFINESIKTQKVLEFNL